MEYLDIAVDLLTDAVEHPADQAAFALAHVKIDDVAERAAVSKSALYHIWTTQEAYWADLLTAMFADTTLRGEYYTRWMAQVSAPEFDGPTPSYSDLCRASFRSRVTNPAFYIRSSIGSYPGRSATGRLGMETKEAGSVYGPTSHSLLHQAGRRLRKEFPSEIIPVCSEAILNGMALRHQYYPDEIRGTVAPDGTSIDPYSLALEALLVHYSEPIDDMLVPPPEPGDVINRPLDDEALGALRKHTEMARREMADPESPSDRSQFYIRIGLDLMGELLPDRLADGDIGALQHIRIANVAERAGVSKGSLYHIWPSQESFRLDVLRHLLDLSSRLSTAAVQQLWDQARSEGWSGEETLRSLCDLSFDSLKSQSWFHARFSYALYAGNPLVAEAFRHGNQPINDLFGLILEESLAKRGRRLIEPIDRDVLVGYAESALYGLTIMYKSSPELIDGHRKNPDAEDGAADSGAPQTIFAEVMEAICYHLSEEI